ncbi:MAG: asparagine synthase (glutamine-hydrolyzing) [Candidatus Dormibacteraeota bacterium]|nr:asparagine synthase (glutamine-hydrolyzing) [Candidatus Dormibacteraeota bacterium]
MTGRDEALLSRMLAVMVHRGPDGSGVEINDQVSLGMRRLAIVDIDTGDQPLYSADRRVALVFNGEIYNAPELRRELSARGHAFTTDHSDTEVILRGYEQWGEDVVDHLTGMFAFAVWDGRTGDLFLARDRLGIKPLYWTESGGRVLFASEIKALFQDASVSRSPDPHVLHRFLIYRVHDSGEDTFFDAVKRLLPGHTMLVRADGSRRVRRYWAPPVNLTFRSTRSDADYADEFRHVFDRVVRRHLIADVPIGVPLSGGLDSSGVATTIAHLMRGGADLHTGGVLHTFSALYPGEWLDESEYIHEIERRVHSLPHYAYPDVDEFWSEMSEWMWYQEEPTIATAPYAYYCVYRIAHREVKVMLSGNGGDELLAGYIPYFRAYLTSAVDQRHPLAGLAEALRGADLYTGYLSDVLRPRLPLAPRRLEMRPLLLSSNGHAAAAHYEASRNLNRRLADDVTAFSTPNLLRYEDKNSMAFSIEARVPFLDHELVEFIFGLPIDQKIKGGWNRAVYRNAMRGRIPEKNRRRRKKIGFSNPEYVWMRARSRGFSDVFESSTFAERGLYDVHKVKDAFAAWLRGAPGDGLIFWRILVCELWMRRYVDQAVALHA